MNDYMQALHRRFFKEPELKELKEEIESVRLSLKAGMSRDDREKLLKRDYPKFCVNLQCGVE